MTTNARVSHKRRWRVVLLLDFDTFAAYRAFPERARFFARTFGVRFDRCRIRRMRSPSGKGWHVAILYFCRRRPSPIFIVAAQAILGSDARRETFNLFRARLLRKAPRAWQYMGRWNTLYDRKYSTALDNARQVRRPKLPRVKRVEDREGDSMAIDREKFAMRERQMPEHLANATKLVPGSLKGAQFAIVTIAEVHQVDANDGEDLRSGKPRFRPVVLVTYKEFPKRIHWLNKMGVNILLDVFGEEESEWVGKQIPIVVKEDVPNPKTKNTEDMLWVANADEWERLFKEDAGQRERINNARGSSNSAAEAARKASEQRASGGKSERSKPAAPTT